MNPNDVAPMIIGSLFLVMGGLTLILRGPIGKAIGRRFEAHPGLPESEARMAELEARVADLERERLELADRIDFAERLLSQVREGRELPR